MRLNQKQLEDLFFPLINSSFRFSKAWEIIDIATLNAGIDLCDALYRIRFSKDEVTVFAEYILRHEDLESAQKVSEKLATEIGNPRYEEVACKRIFDTWIAKTIMLKVASLQKAESCD